MLDYCLVLYNVGLGLVYLCVCQYRYMFKCDMYTWRPEVNMSLHELLSIFFFFFERGSLSDSEVQQFG